MTYLIVVVAALARFVPHPANFSPMYAALLFGGAMLPKRDSLWFPVALVAASDFMLTTLVYRMHFGWAETLDWVGFAAIVMIGMWLRNRASMRNVLAAALAGPTVFFIISNFAVWLGGTLYPPTAAGLAACFVAALPFFGNSLASGILFTGVLFGGYQYFHKRATEKLHLAAH
jgi:uncharacterized protein DUF6580